MTNMLNTANTAALKSAQFIHDYAEPDNYDYEDLTLKEEEKQKREAVELVENGYCDYFDMSEWASNEAYEIAYKVPELEQLLLLCSIERAIKNGDWAEVKNIYESSFKKARKEIAEEYLEREIIAERGVY